MWTCIWRGRIRWLGLLPIFIGAALIPLTPRADILVTDNGRLVAVRDANNILLLSPGRADGFTRQSWIEREGEGGSGEWPEENGGMQKDTPLSCDAKACLYKGKGHLVSFVKDYTALAEDCAAADIVISSLDISRDVCAAPYLLLDKNAFMTNGAHALYFAKNGLVTVRTVYAERGERPWTAWKRDAFDQ